MAKSNAVWGIDIGQCSFKALRCATSDDGQRLVALAFDYIEYPQILSQPDADPVALVRDALELFLSRNEVRGDQLAVSVPGQSSLARFIKLPPVESKKLAAIVSYEAKQQIPFPLDEVVWDYQKMPGASEDEGFALETEVGLFAMKRDQVFRALRPFEKAVVEIDVVQLSPLAIYNFAVFDQMSDLPPPEEYSPDNPPESTVIISIGTDSTDLVVTNGYRVWQRSVPLGGSHFTKQLSKELKLTFAKAEHLKRNANEAKDTRRVFQAMRPVFKGFVTEIQRSIGFFQSLEREAKVKHVMALGNALKLPGLLQYLEKSLGYSVTCGDKFRRLERSPVVSTPTFEDNMLSFPVCYGLTVQVLGQSTINTNLLPREIVTRRIVRQKKPWAVFGVALLMIGCLCHFFFTWMAWAHVHQDQFAAAMQRAQGVAGTSQGHLSDKESQEQAYERLKLIGEAIVKDDEDRRLIVELVRAIQSALPREEALELGGFSQRPLDERPNLYVETIDSRYFSDLSTWWNEEVEKHYEDALDGTDKPNQPAATAPDPNSATQDGSNQDDFQQDSFGGQGSTNQDSIQGPTGPGWVIEIRGYHFHNKDRRNEGPQYVRNTLVRNLREGDVELPDGPDGQYVKVSMEELGIKFPILVPTGRIDKNYQVMNPDFDPVKYKLAKEESEKKKEEMPSDLPPPTIVIPRCAFLVQFCWQETPLSKRLEEKKIEKEKETADSQQDDNSNST